MRGLRLRGGELAESIRDKLQAHSFFTSPGFANLWKSSGGRPVYWCIEKEGDLVAVLPAVEFGRKPLLRLQAMPDGCYANLKILDGSLDMVSAATLILKSISGYGYTRVYVTDEQNAFPLCDGYDQVSCATTKLDISDPSWRPAERNVRKEVRAAQRRGVVALPFERERHFDLFLELISRTKDEPQRIPKKPTLFFSSLADLAAWDSRVRWLVIEHDSRVAASLISVVEGDMVLAWKGFFDREHASLLKPNNLLFYTVVNMARLEGISFFNPGATPEVAHGTATFKRKWGGHEHNYRTLEARNLLGKLA